MENDGDEAYYLAIAGGMDTNMMTAARDFGKSFLYQESYSTNRAAVLSACQTHKSILIRLLQIKQSPDLAKIEIGLRRYYAPIGRAYLNMRPKLVFYTKAFEL